MEDQKRQEEERERAASLRVEAEKRLARASGAMPQKGGKTHEDIVQELNVHQIELEMQNEALRKSQLELEESRDRYADLYDFAPVGYFTFRQRGIIAEVNLTGASLLGVERKKLLDRGFGRFVAEEDLARWDRYLFEVNQSMEKKTCELLLKRGNGINFYAGLESVRVDSGSGTSIVRSVVSDISERKQTERLQALSAEILAILNDQPVVDDAIKPIVTTIKRSLGFDAVGVRVPRGDDFPYAAQEGFSEEFLLTENTLAVRDRFGEVCVDKDGNISLECVCGIVISGRTDPVNAIFTSRGSFWTNESSALLEIPIAQDPRLHPRNRCIHGGFHSMALIPLRDDKKIMGILQLNDRRPNRFTPGLISFFEDLSAIIGTALARKQAERIRALNEQLKLQVAELNAFAYSIAHDLHAPLRHITGFVGLLQQRLMGYSDVQIRDYMDTISEAAIKMGMLIDNILNFSRLGRSEMHKRKVNLNTMLSEVIRGIQEELKERDIIWSIAELPTVMGDQSLLRIVLVNLVYNAIKFTRTRTQSEIRIGCQDDGDKFICSVADNGVGFDMKYVNKLFGVFQRLHSHNEFEGTGIGLANVQRIIARHGGKVWAEGAVGQGATFYFTLPKIKEE